MMRFLLFKRFVLSLFGVIFTSALSAQSDDWVSQMLDPEVNFYTAQESFEKYWAEKPVEKGKGWKQFKRWEAFMEPRVYPDGIRPSGHSLTQVFNQLQADSKSNLGQWRPVGPFNGSSLDGIGRINRITFDPTNAQVVWAGAPAGGLWKSIDGGQTWTTNTDELANLGISDIVIDPQDNNVMYIATGDRDAGDTYSFGILKSIDGGQNWSLTGMVHNVTSQVRITDIHINPSNTDILLATTSQGIYRTTDAGASWTRVQTGNYNSIVQRPGNTDVLFCSALNSTRIYKSTDNGVNWSIITSNTLPAGNVRRIELAVTPADTGYIYALYGSASSNGFLGFYRSTDGGDTWTTQATSPNLLGWSTTGSDNGGQAWYDLALAVSPTDKNEVFVGGVNIWESSNGGSSWSLAAHWYGGGGAPYVHADIHHLIYNPISNHLYAGTDGGVYRHKDNQFSWDQLNDGMNITQYYKFSTAPEDTTLIIAGAQDNGTHLRSQNGWNDVYGGDGMDCAIDPKNSNIMYASVYYGDFFKSTNGGGSFSPLNGLGPAGSGNWVTPFMLDPLHPDTIYTGFSQVYRSFNGGASFTPLTSSGAGSGNIDVLGIAPEHTNNVFMANANRLYHSDDYGNSWTRLTSLSTFRSISSIAVAHDDPDHIVVTISGYSSTEKVFQSLDGGSTWTNLSTGLPNIPVNCAVIEDNDEHGLYIGTDVGVYYRDDLRSDWIRFNSGLPNVIVTELEINYQIRKLRAATYGRGVWQTLLYGDLVPPVADMDLPQNICVNDSVNFLNSSEYSPANFKWHISPNTYTYVNGTSDTVANPQLTFSTKGFYNVSLVVNNLLGSDSIYKLGAIAVGGYPLPYKEQFDDLNDFRKWSAGDNEPGSWEYVIANSGDSYLRSNLFNDSLLGRYEIISPAVDFTNHDSVWLSFNHAYSGTLANKGDSLLVYIATGCADDWNLIAAYGEDGTNNFVTTSHANGSFDPGINDWCGLLSGFSSCNQVDLKSYAGMEGVRVKFVAVSNSGNNLYLDDIVLEGNPVIAPDVDFSAQQVACALDSVLFMDQTYGSPNNWEWTFAGPANLTSSKRNPSIRFTTPGTYSVKLKAVNHLGEDSISKSSYITINPADSVEMDLNYQGQYVCATDSLHLTTMVVNAGITPVYNWYVNGNLVTSTKDNNYSFYNLRHQDTIYAALSSSLDCAYPQLAYSDTAIINVYPVTPLQIDTLGKLCVSTSPATLSATPAGGSFSGPGVSGSTFDPQAAGGGVHPILYTYQDGNGCTFEEILNVEVETAPQISISSNYSICEGDKPGQLNMALPAGGTYSGPGISNNILDPSVLGAGSHAISYTYQQAPCAPVTRNFNINIAQTDTPEVYAGNNQLICSIVANSYQWFYANGQPVIGANSRIYVPATAGQYRVAILDKNNCFSRSQLVSFNIGLEELNSDLKFKLYPNPATDELTVELDGLQGTALEVVISNSIGAKVSKQLLQTDRSLKHTFDISNYAPGVYTITFYSQDILLSRKIVIQR